MTTEYKTVFPQDVVSRKSWIGRLSFVFFILAYGLFLVRYFLRVGSESVCFYSSSCYKTYLSHDSLIISGVAVCIALAIGLLIFNIFRNPATRPAYIRFFKYFIPVAVVLQTLSMYPIAFAPVALSSGGEEILFIPTALLLSLIFIFSSLYIAFSKKRSVWIVAPIMFIFSIVLIIGHYFLLSAVSDEAKEHRDFFLEHCEFIKENKEYRDNKMQCF